MKVFTLDEFAARRRAAQDAATTALLPFVTDWLAAIDNRAALDEVITEATRLFVDTYHDEGGEGTPATLRFAAALRAALTKTTEDSRAQTVATLIAVYTTNAATVQAAGDDAVPLLLEWVTMHDDAVRPAHKDAEGQQRPPGEMFDVGGEELPFPGFPGVSIENWINCRCTVRPLLAEDATTGLATEGVKMTATEAETTEVPPEEQMTGAIEWHGVLAPEGVWSGDGRRFAENALRFRDLPLPLTWQKASSDGHSGSVVIGRIDQITRVENEMRGNGVFLINPEADEFIGMLAEFGKFGVSVDADDAEFDYNDEDGKVTFTSARIASASCVAIPAFSEAYVAMGPWAEEEGEVVAVAASAAIVDFGRGPGWITNPVATKRIHDYWTRPGEEGYAKINWGVGGDFNRCRVLVGEEIAENSPEDTVFLNQICAQWHHDALGIWPGEHLSARDTIEAEPGPSVSLLAGGGYCAPSEWFENPGLDKPTHLTVTEEGRVFGHIAEWESCHIGYEGVCVAPPRSPSNYAYYATGKVLLDNGAMARTGVISLGAGHAGPRLRPRAAVEHYDSTSAAVADVSVGEDEHGIWCAGWIRPGVSDEEVTALRASDVSGDWREFGGELDMVAALACNVAGLPVKVSARVAGGVQMSLTAAGVVHESDPLEALTEQVAMRLDQRRLRRERMRVLAQRVQGGE